MSEEHEYHDCGAVIFVYGGRRLRISIFFTSIRRERTETFLVGPHFLELPRVVEESGWGSRCKRSKRRGALSGVVIYLSRSDVGGIFCLPSTNRDPMNAESPLMFVLTPHSEKFSCLFS